MVAHSTATQLTKQIENLPTCNESKTKKIGRIAIAERSSSLSSFLPARRVESDKNPTTYPNDGLKCVLM